MSYSSNISISARHASDLCGVIRLAPSLWGTAPSSSSISCSTNYSNRCPPYVLKILRRSDLGGPAIFQNLPHLFFLLNVLFSGKTGLSESSSYDEGRSGKFEQLDKPSSVSDFIENNLRIDFNSSILFKILSLLA